jgi:PAS domain S-box-containing protein
MNAEEPVFWTPILYDIARALESLEDPEARIERVLRLMARFVSYDRCAVLESESMSDRPISITLEPSLEERDRMLARLHGLLALLSESPLEEVHYQTLPRVPGRVHLAVPILGLGETTGIMFVERDAPPYEEAHLAFLAVIAAQLGSYLSSVRADRELRASEARFRRLYDSGLIGIVFLDGSGTITDANEAFASIVERPRAELRARGSSWLSMAPPEQLEHDREAIGEAIDRGTCVPYEKRFVRKGKGVITVLAGIARLESRDSLVGFVLDVSAHKRTETERANLLKQRESELEFLELFMGMLGHDLRDPLNAIKMSAQYLHLTNGEQAPKMADRILASTQRMERMVAQLFDLTRIRLAGGLPIEPQRVDLRDICSRVIDEVNAARPDAAIQLVVTGDVTGTWDGDRLLQVVSNLLGNAIVHVRGSKDVTLRLTGTEDTVELAVHNAGAIPETILPVIFDPFRGAQVRGKRHGLGLGLFIIRHIVEAHGGSIEVDSSEQHGTTFTVRLPRDRTSGYERPARAGEGAGPMTVSSGVSVY